MGAYVDHQFASGFFLDEERLRKLHDLINARTSKFSAPLEPKYKVYRGDSYSYETASVDQVVTEDNSDWRAITKLEILLNQQEVFDFKLVFDASKNVTLSITGDDRDAVFLLFSDIREYLSNEVLGGRRISSAAAQMMATATTGALMVGFLYMTMSQAVVDPSVTASVLSSESVVQKLNFLIDNRMKSTPDQKQLYAIAAIFTLMIVLQSGIVKQLWKTLFPTNLFIFGQRKLWFERRKRVLNNVFWVVGVGLMVSVVASLLVWKMTV